MIDRVVGNYQVVQRLGDGGMGTVYRAVDRVLERDVAIKVLRPDLADRDGLVERFTLEARALARLNHPNIATLHGLEQHDGELLMIMEFVRGETLEQIVQRSGALPWPRAVDFCARVLDALDHAHEMGVVHRDIKPANIMLSQSGQVKVMDFGIARLRGQHRHTRAGHAVGTPLYMAPEQLRGLDVDARTDVYAVGAVLFELVSGRAPFDADSDYALMLRKLESEPPSLQQCNTNLPAALDALVHRAMLRDPASRFPTAQAFGEALQALHGPAAARGTASTPAVPREVASTVASVRGITRRVSHRARAFVDQSPLAVVGVFAALVAVGVWALTAPPAIPDSARSDAVADSSLTVASFGNNASTDNARTDDWRTSPVSTRSDFTPPIAAPPPVQAPGSPPTRATPPRNEPVRPPRDSTRRSAPDASPSPRQPAERVSATRVVPPGDGPIPAPESPAATVTRIRGAIADAIGLLGTPDGASRLLRGGVRDEWLALAREQRITVNTAAEADVQLGNGDAQATVPLAISVRSPFGANRRHRARARLDLTSRGGTWHVTGIQLLDDISLR